MILTEKFLRKEANENNKYNFSGFLENRKYDENKNYDLFISHSYMDKKLVEVLYGKFEEAGYSVYIDWKEEELQNRENVSANTANILKRRINNCLGLAYIATENITKSKWCPWELGYSDGKKNKAAIFPILKSDSKEFKGLEYLGIYPYIDYKINESGKYEFWVNDPDEKNKYTSLREWLKTGKLTEHNK